MPRIPLRRALACLLTVALVLQGLPLSAAVVTSAASVPQTLSPVLPLSIGVGSAGQTLGASALSGLAPGLGSLPSLGPSPSVRVDASRGASAATAASPRAAAQAISAAVAAPGVSRPLPLSPAPASLQPAPAAATLPTPVGRPGPRVLAPAAAAARTAASEASDSVLPAAGSGASRSSKGLEDGVWRHALSRGFERGASDPAALAEIGHIPSGRPLEKPSASPDSPQSPAPPAPAAGTSRTARGILASVIGAELWLETGAFIIPFIARSLTGSFFATALISAGSVAALAVGSLVGGPAIDRFGVRSVYVTGLVVRATAAAALFGLFVAGALSPALLTGLFAVDYLFTGANRVAEASAPTLLYRGDLKKINRFGAWKQRAIELVGISSPLLVGKLITSAGFGPALAVFGGVLALAALVASLTVRPPPAAAVRPTMDYRAAFRELARNPTLRWAAAAFALSTAVTYWLYLLVAQAFSLYAAASPVAAAGVMSWVTGAFCVGGLIGTVLSERLARRLSGDRAAFIRSTRLWAVAAGISLLGLWTMLLPGVWPVCLAMLPLGIAFGGSIIQSETLLKTEAPAELRGTILGLVSALSFLAIAAAFLPMGWMFDAWSVTAAGVVQPAAASFTALGSFITALAASFLGFSSGSVSFRPRMPAGAK